MHPAAQAQSEGMRLSHSLINVPTSLSLIGAALFAVACSDSRQLTATGGAGGDGGGGAARAVGGAAGGTTGGLAGAGGATPQQCTTTQPIEACPANQVCDLDAPGRCLPGSLQFGHCIETPQICTSDSNPVCGCDGRTYANDCARQMAQAQLDYTGACRDAGVSTNCGPGNCDPGQTYCSATNPGYAGDPPWTYLCKTIPTECAANPTCACICPSPNGCSGSYTCHCTDTNGLVSVSCEGDM